MPSLILVDAEARTGCNTSKSKRAKAWMTLPQCHHFMLGLLHRGVNPLCNMSTATGKVRRCWNFVSLVGFCFELVAILLLQLCRHANKRVNHKCAVFKHPQNIGTFGTDAHFLQLNTQTVGHICLPRLPGTSDHGNENAKSSRTLVAKPRHDPNWLSPWPLRCQTDHTVEAMFLANEMNQNPVKLRYVHICL